MDRVKLEEVREGPHQPFQLFQPVPNIVGKTMWTIQPQSAPQPTQSETDTPPPLSPEGQPCKQPVPMYSLFPTPWEHACLFSQQVLK